MVGREIPWGQPAWPCGWPLGGPGWILRSLCLAFPPCWVHPTLTPAQGFLRLPGSVWGVSRVCS